MSSCKTFGMVCICISSSISMANSAPLSLPMIPINQAGMLQKIVVIGGESRETLPQHAKRTKQTTNSIVSRYNATGQVKCGRSVGTAQLTLKNNVITTAAHVFYNKYGKARSDLSSCKFRIQVNGSWQSYDIDPSTLRCGSKRPYSEASNKDWAVVKLKKRVMGATPYRIGSAGKNVILLAQQHHNWRKRSKSIELCDIREKKRGKFGNREISITCDAGDGASGSALLRPGSKTMVGIYVGFRSAHPNKSGPFSKRHLNFGVTIEGKFRQAIQQLASR